MTSKANEKLRALREKHQYSQEQLADLLEMAQSTYSRIESGEGKINLQLMDKLSKVFEVDIITLFEELVSDDKYTIHQTNNSTNTNDGESNDSSSKNHNHNCADTININHYAGMNQDEKAFYENQLKKSEEQIKKLEEQIYFLQKLIQEKL